MDDRIGSLPRRVLVTVADGAIGRAATERLVGLAG
jgi:hypothetical protein